MLKYTKIVFTLLSTVIILSCTKESDIELQDYNSFLFREDFSGVTVDGQIFGPLFLVLVVGKECSVVPSECSPFL